MAKKNNKKKTIKIAINKDFEVRWRDIKFFQPENFKINADHLGIANSIKDVGVHDVLHIWIDENGDIWSIDGEQTIKALLMHFDEYDLPEYLPAVEHKAKDKKEAIKVLTKVFNTIRSKVNETVYFEWLENEGLKADKADKMDFYYDVEPKEQGGPKEPSNKGNGPPCNIIELQFTDEDSIKVKKELKNIGLTAENVLYAALFPDE